MTTKESKIPARKLAEKMIGLTALGGFFLVAASGAASAAPRPIEDFLVSQGTACNNGPPPPDGPCAGVVPVPGPATIPVIIAWAGPAPDYPLLAAIDYTGVINKWIVDNGGSSPGTTISGSINERPIAGGLAEVAVKVRTKNALALVEDLTLPPNSPLVMGNHWIDVFEGKKASYADCEFSVTFTNTAPGAPLPDLVLLLIAPEPEQVIKSISISCKGIGTLANGRSAQLVVNQIGNFRGSFKGGLADAFPAEVFKLTPVGPRDPMEFVPWPEE